MKYTSAVYDAIQDYYDFNFQSKISKDEIDKMSKDDVLATYLEWEGIIGYTWIIENIMEAK